MTGPVANPWIREIQAYVPGSSKGNGTTKPVKLSSNENPWGPSPKAVAALQAVAGDSHRYPDGAATNLRQKIASLHNLEADRIVCGTGSDEILQLLPMIYCRPGDSLVHARHSFMVYPIAARRAGALPIEAEDTDYTADVDSLLAAIQPDTRIVFLANPNNPTGTFLPAAEVARLHAGLRPDILLVVDQAYAEYMEDSDPDGGLKLARQFENVLVTRTFSKIYGLGGLRVGWAYGHPNVIAELNRVRAPFPISVPSLAAAEAAVDDQEHVVNCRNWNAEQRAILASAIDAHHNLGLRAIPSAANFVLMECPETGPLTGANIYQKLTNAGYITRWLPGQGLPNALRLSVGTAEENSGLIKALNAIIADA